MEKGLFRKYSEKTPERTVVSARVVSLEDFPDLYKEALKIGLITNGEVCMQVYTDADSSHYLRVEDFEFSYEPLLPDQPTVSEILSLLPLVPIGKLTVMRTDGFIRIEAVSWTGFTIEYMYYKDSVATTLLPGVRIRGKSYVAE